MTYPTIRPALTLDFEKSKKLDPRITFSRSSTATYLDAATGLIKTAPSGVARFEKEGLLVEQSRTNIIPESTNLNNTTHWHTSVNPGSLNQQASQGWMVATANTTEVVSPDGTNNACKLSGNTTSTFDKNYNVHVVPNANSVPMSANVVYTWTLFVKDPDSVLNADNLLVLMYGSRYSNTNARVKFNLSNDTVTYGGDISNESASITLYPNGWKKLTATWTNTSSGGGPRYFIEEQSPQTGGVTQFSANGEKFYVWGFQIEEGSFPTSYIPTSGTTVTRSADVTSITGTNFSNWYNQSEGTLLTTADYNGSNPSNYNMIVEGYSGLSFRDFSCNIGASNPNFTTRYSFTNLDLVPSGGPIPTKTTFKLVGSYSADGSAAVFNGGLVKTTGATTSVLTPADAMSIGRRINSSSLFLNGHISRFTFYPTRVSDASLQELTS